MPTHPGHPAIASTTLVSASRSLLNDAFDSVSIQTLTASATVDPDLGRYILVAPADHMTITLPDPSSDERYQNVRLVLKRTTAGIGAVSVVVAGGGTIDGASSTTLNAQYDCEVLMSDTTAGVWHRLRDASNLLAPDYLDFGDWIVGTDDSNPAPTATSDQYVAPDGTTTADKIEWDNSTELADESWAEPGAASIEAGDTAQYSFYIDSEVGDGVKTVLEVGDSSVPQITEQATVAFSNVFAENLMVSEPFIHDTSLGSFTVAPTQSATAAPDATLTAFTASNNADIQYGENFNTFGSPYGDQRLEKGHEYTWSIYLLAEADTRTHYLRIYEAISGTESCIAIFDIDTTDGVSVSSFSSVSTGPSYTSANAFRATRVAGTDWYRVSLRIADYSGAANRFAIQFWYRYPFLNTEASFTYWKAELRYGNHITGQQLLTVDDGVENLLTTDAGASADYTDFGNYAPGGGVPVITTSAIAAPDGTLTATHITNTAQLTAMVSTPSDGNWLDDASWTVRIYFYYPSMLSGQLYRTWIRSEAAGGSTALEQSFVQLGTTGSTPSIAAYSGTTSGSEPYSQEKNVDLKAIGDTGWYRLDLSINAANSPASAEIVYVPLQGNSSLAEFVFWNPTLRYGDWVSRGKNRVTSGEDLLDPDWTHTNATVTRSDEVTPAGTRSAVLVVPDAGSRFLNQDGPKQQWEVPSVITDPCRVTLSAYYKDAGLGFAALGLSNSAGYLATAQIDLATGAAGPVGTHPDPASDLTIDFEDVGSGWKKCSFSMTLPIGATYMRNAHFTGSSNQDSDNSPFYSKITADGTNGVHIWGAKVTVGNPADARGYFVSGPQNLLGDGSDYSGWSTGTAPQDVTVTTNQLVAPNGRLEADTITHTQGDNTYHYDTAASVLSGGETVSYHWYFKVDSTLAAGAGETVQFSIKNSGGTVIEQINWAVAYDDATPTVALGSTTTAGSGYTTDALEYVAISNDWVRCSITLTDFGSTGQDVEVYHYGLDGATSAGATYDVTLWGSEITTIDRTPTATDLRPISGGIVDYDAYPAEHRSLFASYEDAGDNWYKVTMNLTEPN
jgi:hypothetical protein